MLRVQLIPENATKRNLKRAVKSNYNLERYLVNKSATECWTAWVNWFLWIGKVSYLGYRRNSEVNLEEREWTIRAAE